MDLEPSAEAEVGDAERGVVVGGCHENIGGLDSTVEAGGGQGQREKAVQGDKGGAGR